MAGGCFRSSEPAVCDLAVHRDEILASVKRRTLLPTQALSTLVGAVVTPQLAEVTLDVSLGLALSLEKEKIGLLVPSLSPCLYNPCAQGEAFHTSRA